MMPSRTLEIPYDAEGIPRVGKSDEEKECSPEGLIRIWDSRSRLHLNTDFRFNSQSLAFAITKDESIGGRAWPGFKMKNADHDGIASLWYNSTLGILSSMVGSEQIAGRAKSNHDNAHPCLCYSSPRKLKPAQIGNSEEVFSI